MRVAAIIACLASASPAWAEPARVDPNAAMMPNGLAMPYPTLRIFRAFGHCLRAGKRPERFKGKWRSHDHEGIDLGGLGPDGGLGGAIRSMTYARVVAIARGSDDAPRYGTADLRDGDIDRDGTAYPRSFELAGYGLVHFFTRHRGYWRTGNMVVTEGLGGPLDRHTIRYLHLGAVHPDLKVGDLLVPGQELGVLGGTAVQDSAPHLHLDLRDPDGEAVDPAPLLGLATSAWCGVPRARAVKDREAFRLAAAGRPEWRPETWAPPVGRAGLAGRSLATLDLLRTPAGLVSAGLVKEHTRFWHDLALVKPCQAAVYAEDFASGAYGGHAWRVPVTHDQVLDVAVVPTGDTGTVTFAVSVDARLLGAIVPDATRAWPVPDALAPALATPLGDATRVHVEVLRTSDLTVSVLAPSATREKSSQGGYRLTITERCRAPIVKQLSHSPDP